MNRFAVCTVSLLLAACETQVAQPDVNPDQLTPVATPPTQPSPVPAPQADPAHDRCAVGFSSDDANAAFSLLSSVRAEGCVFDAVRVRGTSMRLVWKRGDTPVPALDVHPKGCGTGTEIGAFALASGGDLDGLCPGLHTKVQELLETGRFPVPSEPSGAEETGPDGDGQGSPQVAAELPPSQPKDPESPDESHADTLPPKQPPGIDPAPKTP